MNFGKTLLMFVLFCSSSHADSGVLEAHEYKVLPSSQGTIRIESGGRILYADISQLYGGPCNASDKRHCILFPNGQRVIASAELTPLLPIRSMFRGH